MKSAIPKGYGVGEVMVAVCVCANVRVHIHPSMAHLIIPPLKLNDLFLCFLILSPPLF